MGLLKDPQRFYAFHQLDTDHEIPSVPKEIRPSRQPLPLHYSNPCPYWHATPPPELKKRDWGTIICTGYTLLIAGVLLIKLLLDAILK